MGGHTWELQQAPKLAGRRQLPVPELQLADVRRDVRVRRGAHQGMPDLREAVAEALHRRPQQEQLHLLVHHGPEAADVEGQRARQVRDRQEDDGNDLD